MYKDAFQDAGELEIALGEQLQKLRLAKNLDQQTVAERAGIAVRSLRNLEAGRGSTVATFVRVLRALDRTDILSALNPTPTINPMELLRKPTERQRATGSRRQKTERS